MLVELHQGAHRAALLQAELRVQAEQSASSAVRLTTARRREAYTISSAGRPVACQSGRVHDYATCRRSEAEWSRSSIRFQGLRKLTPKRPEIPDAYLRRRFSDARRRSALYEARPRPRVLAA